MRWRPLSHLLLHGKKPLTSVSSLSPRPFNNTLQRFAYLATMAYWSIRPSPFRQYVFVYCHELEAHLSP